MANAQENTQVILFRLIDGSDIISQVSNIQIDGHVNLVEARKVSFTPSNLPSGEESVSIEIDYVHHLQRVNPLMAPLRQLPVDKILYAILPHELPDALVGTYLSTVALQNQQALERMRTQKMDASQAPTAAPLVEPIPAPAEAPAAPATDAGTENESGPTT